MQKLGMSFWEVEGSGWKSGEGDWGNWPTQSLVVGGKVSWETEVDSREELSLKIPSLPSPCGLLEDASKAIEFSTIEKQVGRGGGGCVEEISGMRNPKHP